MRFCEKIKIIFCASLVVFILSSCTFQPILEGQKASPELLDRLFERAELIKRWKLRGEVQVKNGSRSWRINILWYQKSKTFKMRVSAITQATLFVINGKRDGSVSAINARGEQYQSDNQKQLMKQLFGIELPLDYLKSWVIGMPSAQVAYQNAQQSNNRLIAFMQDGWQIEYRYKQSSQNIKEVVISSGPIRMLLKIRSFKSE